jgi:magnesium transporter
MSNATPETPTPSPALVAAVESALAAQAAGDLETVMEQVAAELEAGDLDAVAAVLAALRPADRADVFEALDLDQQSLLIGELTEEEAADILEELEDEDAAEVAGTLDPEELAPILDQMEPDEAADVLGDLTPEQAESALLRMDDEAEAEVRSLLVFTDESAGGRMTPDFVALQADETVARSIEQLRQLAPESEVTYYLYVIDAPQRLVGVVNLRQLIVSEPTTPVEAIMDRNVIQVSTDDDQETAARLMARYDLLALPVVDGSGHLVGVITHDDLVDVLEEEATEDMYRLVGLDEQARPLDPVGSSVQRRLPWLVLNLMTQLILVTVLFSFQNVMARVSALAVLFPLVTGNGGNVGAQTTTIVVRSLALGEIGRNERRVLVKEVTVGLLIGLVMGLLGAVVAFFYTSDRHMVALVATAMFMAMALNLAAGGLAGVVVPLGLRRIGLDPAVASAVFVTTVTDTLGALLFLGFFTLLLR